MAVILVGSSLILNQSIENKMMGKMCLFIYLVI